MNLLTTNNPLYFAPIIICIYIIWEDFVSISNPSEVTITDESITFGAFGRKHTFLWSEIKLFTIKEFVSSRKMFIRINDAGLLKGRYWVNCYFFVDGEELYMWLRDKEYALHPNSLKAQARRSNEKDYEERQIRNAKKLKEREAKQQARLEKLGIKKTKEDK